VELFPNSGRGEKFYRAAWTVASVVNSWPTTVDSLSHAGLCAQCDGGREAARRAGYSIRRRINRSVTPRG